MAIREMLSDLGMELRKDRPLVPASFGHRIVVAEPGRRFAQVWLRTRGCRHDLSRGGCTICNYWASSPAGADELVTSMEAALDELQFDPATLVLSASGSFFDPWEIDPEARRRILEILRERCPKADVILETHHDTVTAEIIAECSRILGHPWTIEMGFESADPIVLRCCLNKPINPEDFLRTLEIIHQEPSVKTIANIVLGAPFLTSNGIIDDAVATVQWAFDHGVDECVLFPMNLKPYTLAYWLAEHSLYAQPSLWLLVDVLAAMPAEILSRVNFAWHRVDRGQESLWDKGIIPPKTCDACYQRVITSLDSYLGNGVRDEIVHSLKSDACSCGVNWREENRDPRPLSERLLKGYQVAATDILGAEYWGLHGHTVREELDQLFLSQSNRSR